MLLVSNGKLILVKPVAGADIKGCGRKPFTEVGLAREGNVS